MIEDVDSRQQSIILETDQLEEIREISSKKPNTEESQNLDEFEIQLQKKKPRIDENLKI